MKVNKLDRWKSCDQGYSMIFLAAGCGQRFGNYENKVLRPVLDDGRPVFDYSLAHYLADYQCQRIFFVYNPKHRDHQIIENYVNQRYSQEILQKIVWVPGGKTRQDSVYAGLKRVKKNYLVIQEAARPLISRRSIQRLLKAVMKDQYPAASLAIPIYDTVHEKEGSFSKTVLNREQMVSIQTPQAFQTPRLKRALATAIGDGQIFNEEGGAMLYANQELKLVLGERNNLKLTTREDMVMIQTYVSMLQN